MSGRIPQNFIDDLLARIDIVELIDNFVPLRKAGKNYQARCPFHDEKTPSFTVSRDKQFYHCFGCGTNGTAISFLMEYNHMGFIEAVEDLASRAGVEIPREPGLAAKDDKLVELYELTELAVRYYRRQLREHAHADRAVNYLKQRGISGELAADFELGYAPAGWDNLINELGKSDAAQHRLATVGLVIRRENGGYYDRFRDRVMFPIRDQRGRAIGFGGRVIDDGTPKYLNSPETPIFHKGRELYGLYRVRQKNRNIERLYIVEGYMDVLALGQFGIDNVVASLGTAATADHLDRIFRTTAQVVFCFDGDEAGQKAAWRAIETVMPLLRDGKLAYFMFMPQGEDPDSYVRKHGAEGFLKQELCIPLSDYLLSTLRQNHNLSTREGRAGLVEQAVPYLSLMPNSALKQLLMQDLGKLTGTDSKTLESFLHDKGPTQGPKSRKLQRPSTRHKETLVSRMVAGILHQPGLALLVDEPQIFHENPLPGVDFLKQLVELVQSRPQITCPGIIEHWRDSKYEKRLKELAADDIVSETHNLEQEFTDAIEKIQAAKRKQTLRNLTNVSSLGELSEEDKVLLREMRSSGSTVREK